MSSTVPAYTQKQLKQAIEWFVKLQAETCPPEQQQKFQQWLAKHPGHFEAYTQAQGIWSGLDSLKTESIPGLTQARMAKSGVFKNSTVSICSGLLLSVLLTAAYREYSAETVFYSTQLGERRSIALADHSQLTLNTNSQVSVRISPFQRQVVLSQGEALFTVQHERLRPFAVQAGALNIRDIGTRFNVKYQQDRTTVSVLEGEVELHDGRKVDHQPLSAGQQLVYHSDAASARSEMADNASVTAWVDGHLVFKRTPLSEVTAELERYHPVHFAFADPALARETLSGTFDSGDFKPFLHALENIMPVRAKQNGTQIVLRKSR